ncbi:hypothetical protein TEA_011955 [Camellia sinensis var. sinensis]|uniref:At3g05675-like ankyrin-like domain-containing protein n=1 Tax=Camellia sinensis var. sinensis TaxID=542762 RepID=A0A4S4DRD0_CAMSN|nr:hypothetical protein TEA_011955 [Camellia sinensis var. sinensis]
MDNSTRHKPHHRRQPPTRRRSWCCSFAVTPRSPENPTFSHPKPPPKPETPSKSAGSFPNSPQNSRLGLVGRIDPRRILSPGRVSPIDSDHPTVDSLPEIVVPIANVQSRSVMSPMPEGSSGSGSGSADNSVKEEDGSFGIFDVRLNLKGKSGGSLVLELNSEVLSASSSVFADLIADYRKGVTGSAANLCRIEVPEVENLNVFRETIGLMFDDDIPKRLLKIGVYRSIDILEQRLKGNDIHVSDGGLISEATLMKAVVESRSVEEENWKVVEDLEGYDGKGRREIYSNVEVGKGVNSDCKGSSLMKDLESSTRKKEELGGAAKLNISICFFLFITSSGAKGKQAGVKEVNKQVEMLAIANDGTNSMENVRKIKGTKPLLHLPLMEVKKEQFLGEDGGFVATNFGLKGVIVVNAARDAGRVVMAVTRLLSTIDFYTTTIVSQIVMDLAPIDGLVVAVLGSCGGGSVWRLCWWLRWRFHVLVVDGGSAWHLTSGDSSKFGLLGLILIGFIAEIAIKCRVLKGLYGVSAVIMFTRGVLSCLRYLEAMPWNEEEEEKLRSLFNRFKLDDDATRDILARLYLLDSADSQQRNLARQLVLSITTCPGANARNELKSLVKGLLCKSSIYEKHYADIDEDDLYVVCQSCLSSLVVLLEEASGTTNGNSCRKLGKKVETDKPLIERISNQVDNINWLLEILLDRQMAEEFVEMWADQGKLLCMHGSASPMVRYELSRVSAMLFIALGTRKLHCRSEVRLGLLEAWFSPMLLDFGWLQRCRKGLDMRELEEAMGQALLTLPLKHQYVLFMEWFRCFSKHGTECPNLSKAFQIWWRRSFLRGSESYAIESSRGRGRGDDIVLEEAPQILEEDVIDNGSRDNDDAADVDQAEEVLTGPFPRGPLDPLILKSFKAHIAVTIWEQKHLEKSRLSGIFIQCTFVHCLAPFRLSLVSEEFMWRQVESSSKQVEKPEGNKAFFIAVLHFDGLPPLPLITASLRSLRCHPSPSSLPTTTTTFSSSHSSFFFLLLQTLDLSLSLSLSVWKGSLLGEAIAATGAIGKQIVATGGLGNRSQCWLWSRQWWSQWLDGYEGGSHGNGVTAEWWSQGGG